MIVVFLVFLIGSPSLWAGTASRPLSSSEIRQFRKYREATLDGIEHLRAPNGLVNDEAFVSGCHLQIMAHKTTPTNVALDIINQLELLDEPARRKQALSNLTRTMNTLQKMDVHDSGLFFSTYSTDAGADPLIKNVSSVDNIHLALALWTAHRLAPQSEFGKTAGEILKKMNFSIFTTPEGMLGGNLTYKNGKWDMDNYRYDYLGSEARSIYALADALGLYKPLQDGKDSYATSLPKFHETYSRDAHPIVKTWDGGAFQLYLPEMLIGEDQFSPPHSMLEKSFDNEASLGLQLEKENSYPLPALFSACDRGVGGTPSSHEKTYSGKVGFPALAGDDAVRKSAESDDTVSPHAVMMAATRAPHEYAAELRKTEKLKSLSKPHVPLYCRNLGFMDGYRVKGPDAHEVVSTQFSLDQGIVLLALNHILSPDRQNVTSRALFSDSKVNQKLRAFYTQVNDELLSPDRGPGTLDQNTDQNPENRSFRNH